MTGWSGTVSRGTHSVFPTIGSRRMATPLSIATILLYTLSSVLYVMFLQADRLWVGRAASLFLAAAIVLHYATLVERSRLLGAVPYQDLYGSMSLFGWLLAVTYLGLEFFHKQRSVGPFVLPLVLVLILAAIIFEPTRVERPASVKGAIFALHVTTNILAYSAFALSCVLSLIYLLQTKILRHGHPGRASWKYPSLESLERMCKSSVILGVSAMCIGTALGLVWVHRLWGTLWITDAKVLASITIVALYLGYLRAVRSNQWRGARAAKLCALCFLAVIFSLTIVNVYLSGYHRYF